MTCSRCGGFHPSTAEVCPHCDAKLSRGRGRRWAAFLGLAGCTSLGLTMMACYGAPPCRSGDCIDPEPHDAGGDTSTDTVVPN
jgi:hypothetical protein